MLLLYCWLLLLTFVRSSIQIQYSCNASASCGCSSSSAVVSSRIVGGENAATNTWGWAVSLLIDNQWLCGGSIVSSSWIITAAQCVENMDASQIIVSAGTNMLLDGTQARYAYSVIIHPAFNDQTFENDIALIKVAPPFNMSDAGIATICLPPATTTVYPPVNSTLVAIGWGMTVDNGNVSDTLRQTTLKSISSTDVTCSSLIVNATTEFCAGAINSTSDTCMGDEGGPLMMFTPGRQWVLAGVISYGQSCATPGFASVYTRVVYYLDWIRANNVTDAITADTVTNTPATSVSTGQTTVRSNGSPSISNTYANFVWHIVSSILLNLLFIHLI